MRLHHMALALLVVAIWGINFVVIKVGLKEIPPILLCALRFFLAAFPAIFFIKRPPVPFYMIIKFGLIMFALQFALLFSGMHAGTTAGLASLLLQIQVFFTVLLAVVFLAERPSVWQIAGALVAFSGIGFVAANIGGEVSAYGLILIVAAAALWGIGNLMSKQFGKIDMLALVVWSSLIAWPPLLLLSSLMEQDSWRIEVFTHISWLTVGAIGYIVYPVTLLGFAAWSWLLSLYPASTVAPFTLLVPVFGFTASTLVLDEPLQSWKIIAAALVISGLCINLFGPRIAVRFRPG
ncbi:EamA family transporter [Candidatus Methylospira mobilis]|uniref:EamA family transporter n=1 Tax=Candidatus Methylospira mobilis TaxID=1808979 RepID=UPI0028ECBEDA|nr:EamA family transporter [Candidatus Methylospira mobilis]WNV06265.1 EamA family transporter [Candidatus Methylospira mobilis]